MRVKIGNKWFDSDDQPICIQINDVEQNHISQIDRKIAESGKYAVFPDNTEMTVDQMREWMNEA